MKRRRRIEIIRYSRRTISTGDDASAAVPSVERETLDIRPSPQGAYFKAPERTMYWVVVASLSGLFTFQLWLHIVRTSATIDEPVHLLAGHRHWQCGDFGINPEHPPLLKLLAAAPLNPRKLVEPNWECGSKLTSKFDSFSFGNSFLVENGVDSVLIPVRAAAASMSLLLAALVFLAAWEMFGRWEALTALALLAFEPSLIANGTLVMTDMALTATAFAAVYALYRFGKQQSWFRLLTIGLAFGLLLAAKHSAVVFVPILFGLFIADALVFRRSGTRVRVQILRHTAAFAVIFLAGLILLWGLYGFRYYSIPSATGDAVSVADYIRENGRPEMVASLSAKMVDAVNRARIFPEAYVLGMADVIAWGSRNACVFGHNYATGQWWYFPLAFAVKSSVALLLLLPLGLLLPLFDRGKRREMLFLLTPPLLFLAVALTSGMTIGIRHILPVYGFFIVAAAAGAVWLCRRLPRLRYALVALLIFHAAAAARTAPNYLAFSNDFWGGTENTHRIFNDSNVDIGQSIKLVNEYLSREKVGDCWIAGYVHPELLRAIQPCRVLPSGLRVLVSREVIDPVPPVIEGTVLVSVNELPPRSGGEYVPVARSAPVAFLGGNIFVYRGRFEIPLAAAMSRAYRAGQLLRARRAAEAVAEGRKAIELGPGDPRTHLALGLTLASVGQRDEARREFEAVIELAKSDAALFRNTEVRATQELGRLK